MGSLGIPANLDLLGSVVNSGRRASLDTPEQEVLQVLMDLLEHLDRRDSEVIQVSPGNQDT